MAAGRAGGLEVERNLETQRRHWAFQRFGISFMALFTLASAAGLTGKGPLALVKKRGTHGVRVEYTRTLHYNDQTELRVEIPPALLAGGTVGVALSRGYLEGVKLERVVPEPEHVAMNGDFYKFKFAAENQARPLVAVFVISPEKRGRLKGELAAEEFVGAGAGARPGSVTGELVKISQFVFP
jgi:hypothetical protein